jgi:anti-anti-sigma factor
MKDYRITTRFFDDFIVIDVPFRRLDFDTSRILRKKLGELLLGTGIENIMINLSNVNYVDAQGLDVLLFARAATAEKGGKATLIAPRPYVIKTLQSTKLNEFFDIYYSTDEAICSNSYISYLPKPFLQIIHKINNMLNILPA